MMMDRNNRARVEGDVVTAEALRVRDADFASEIAAIDDPAEAQRRCEGAFQLGVRVRSLARATAQVARLAERMFRAAESIERDRPSVRGKLTQAIQAAKSDSMRGIEERLAYAMADSRG